MASLCPENRSRNTLVIVGGLLATGAAVFVSFACTTDCGGNSAALTAVSTYVMLARSEAMEGPDHGFRITSATPEQRAEVAHLPGAPWLRRAHFLVSTAPITAESSERHIIIVCDTPYRNVPRRWIGSAPAMHAAGFSDGSTALISLAEFASLDRSRFITLDELYSSNSK